MENEIEVLLGPALTTWNDYLGTAAADEAPAHLKGQIYDASGLDPSSWWIIAVDLSLHGTSDLTTYYALDRRGHRIDSHSDLLEVVDREGQIPVAPSTPNPKQQVPAGFGLRFPTSRFASSHEPFSTHRWLSSRIANSRAPSQNATRTKDRPCLSPTSGKRHRTTGPRPNHLEIASERRGYGAPRRPRRHAAPKGPVRSTTSGRPSCGARPVDDPRAEHDQWTTLVRSTTSGRPSCGARPVDDPRAEHDQWTTLVRSTTSGRPSCGARPVTDPRAEHVSDRPSCGAQW